MPKATTSTRLFFFLIADSFISLCTFYTGFALRFNFSIPNYAFADFPKLFFILLLFKLCTLAFFGIYLVPWRFFGLSNLVKLVKAHFVAYFLFGLIFLIFREKLGFLPLSTLLMDCALSLLGLGALRATKRLWLQTKNIKETPTLIIGAGTHGELAARWLLSHNTPLFPVAFLDALPSRQGLLIHDLKVYSFDDLTSLVNKFEIKSAVIAESCSPVELKKIIEVLKSSGIKSVKKLSVLDQEETKIRDIGIEELLAREPKDLDKQTIESFIRNKIVLITGAGGSIGSEIVRQCERFGAKHLVLVDNSEYNLYAITEELKAGNFTPYLVNVTDKQSLQDVFKTHKPQIVIHAAAYKHVPLVEANITQGIRNNILGTKTCIDLAIESEVEKFILISTDKAVRPTNVMGATKRVCELYAQNVAFTNCKTEIAAVRFGNVIGSSGSVIPKFKALLEKNESLTVTHPEIERYFMLISEACELVLQAAAIAKGGEIFILDMGERVKIVDLAKRMIELGGKSGEVDIVFTGLRPGEKLYEELLTADTHAETRYESIMIANPTKYDICQLQKDIEQLLNSDEQVSILKKIVPEFDHKP